MEEKQKKKFEEWAHKEKFFKKFDGFSPTLTDLAMTANKAWEACLEANKVEEEPEPSPTEMVKAFIDKGFVLKVSEANILFLESSNNRIPLSDFSFEKESFEFLRRAYHKAFPPKRKVGEQESEPTPTEMVKRLLEKGWTVEAYPDTDMTFFRSPDGKNRLALIAAYHQAFPPKKKVEVEVWLDSDGCVRVIPANSDSKGLDPRRVSWGWTKGIATFWVEDKD